MKKLSKKITIIMIILLLVNILGGIFTNVFAAGSTTKIILSDDGITVNGEAISTDSTSAVNLSNSTNNGGTSTDATSSNIEIANIINITAAGTYEFIGSLSDGQISINSNDITGDVAIILNNVSITCENAPAIFVYNKDITSTNCNVTIKTVSGTTNTITGSKIKQSVEGWEDQSSLLYYVDTGYDDERNYYERYKYDGAISSDSKQSYLQLNFNDKVAADTLITILDKDENAQVAFKSDRSYQILTISTPDLETEDITVYEGGTIEGKSQNGLYTSVTSYTKVTEKSYSSVQEGQMPEGFGEDRQMNENSDLKGFYIILAVLIVLLIIAIAVSIILNKKGKSE